MSKPTGGSGWIGPVFLALLAFLAFRPNGCARSRDDINALDARIADLQNSMDELGRAR